MAGIKERIRWLSYEQRRKMMIGRQIGKLRRQICELRWICELRRMKAMVGAMRAIDLLTSYRGWLSCEQTTVISRWLLSCELKRIR